MWLSSSLRGRVVATSVGGALALSAVVLVAVDYLHAEEAQRSFSREAASLAALLADRVEPSLVAGDPTGVQRAIAGTTEGGGLVAVVVFDRTRRAVAAEPAGVAISPALASWGVNEEVESSLVVRGTPAQARFHAVRSQQLLVGGFWVAIDRQPLLLASRRFRIFAALLAVAVVGVAMVIGTIAAESLVRPLDELGETVAQLGRGELSSRHPLVGTAEMQRLARRINRMAETLEASRSDLNRLADNLERQVLERTAQLEEANRRLTNLAHTDPLTGLTNRRGLEIELERYLSLSRRAKQPLALIMMDLDNFKTYNDRCGHLAGDTVLKAVSTALRGRARASDVVARWGGDEFCILVPATEVGGALTAAQRYVISVLEAMQDLSHPDVSIQLGASAGVSCFPEDGEEAVELIARADAALYRVKSSGGSRVMRAKAKQEAEELDEA
jgi:diguanylate cyclase (GGDEF)-like protein